MAGVGACKHAGCTGGARASSAAARAATRVKIQGLCLCSSGQHERQPAHAAARWTRNTLVPPSQLMDAGRIASCHGRCASQLAEGMPVPLAGQPPGPACWWQPHAHAQHSCWREKPSSPGVCRQLAPHAYTRARAKNAGLPRAQGSPTRQPGARSKHHTARRARAAQTAQPPAHATTCTSTGCLGRELRRHAQPSLHTHTIKRSLAHALGGCFACCLRVLSQHGSVAPHPHPQLSCRAKRGKTAHARQSAAAHTRTDLLSHTSC